MIIFNWLNLSKNMSGKKIVIGMGAGSISNWMRRTAKINIMKLDQLKTFLENLMKM